MIDVPQTVPSDPLLRVAGSFAIIRGIISTLCAVPRLPSLGFLAGAVFARLVKKWR